MFLHNQGVADSCCGLQDVEQLLDAHGLASSGPSALLANLYKVLSAAASGLPPPSRE